MGGGGGVEDLSESRLFHILHDDVKNLRRSTNSEMSWIICECNICIEEFYLHHLHRESQLIFEKKLSSNFVNQLYSTHFLQQLPGHSPKISAEKSDAYWKEGG